MGKKQWTEPTLNPVANHKYSKSGTYNVGLKVIDTDGWSGEYIKTAIVNN